MHRRLKECLHNTGRLVGSIGADVDNLPSLVDVLYTSLVDVVVASLFVGKPCRMMQEHRFSLAY